MDKELQNANDELSSLLEAPSSSVQGETEVVGGQECSSENNALVQTQESIDELVEMPVETLAPTAQYQLFQEIDTVCFNIYREIGVIDETFEKISTAFYGLAQVYGELSLNADKEDTVDAKSAAAVAQALAIGALAIKGLGNLFNAIRTQVNIQSKILPLLKREAQNKYGFVSSMYNQMEDICNGNLQVFYAQMNLNYHRDSDQLRNNQEFRSIIKKPIVTSLNLLRDSLYHYRLLGFLLRQFDLWRSGKIGEEEMPHFGDINNEIVYRFIYDAPKEVIDSEIFLRLKEVLGFKQSTDPEQQYIDARIYPIVLDKQLLATYLSSSENRGKNKFEQELKSEYSSCLRTALLSNPAYKTYKDLSEQYSDIESKCSFRMWVLGINTILLTIICGIWSFRYFNSWGWPTLITLAVFLFATYRSYSIGSRITNRFDQKLNALKLYTSNTLRRMSGVRPNVQSLSQLNSSSWGSIWGAVVGAIIGLIFFSVFGLVIGLFIGSLLGGEDAKSCDSDGSEYAEMSTGSGWLSYLIFVVLVGSLIYLL